MAVSDGQMAAAYWDQYARGEEWAASPGWEIEPGIPLELFLQPGCTVESYGGHAYVEFVSDRRFGLERYRTPWPCTGFVLARVWSPVRDQVRLVRK